MAYESLLECQLGLYVHYCSLLHILDIIVSFVNLIPYSLRYLTHLAVLAFGTRKDTKNS